MTPAAAAPSPFSRKDAAEQYDADRFGGAFGSYLERQEVEVFTRLIGAHDAILDAGAGTGKLSLPWLREGRDVTSVDRSRAMLAQAARKAAAAGLRTRLVVADVQALSFPDRAFPCTVSSRVLMHVADWRRAVAELCRVTARLLVIDFPATASAAGLDAALKRRLPRWGPPRLAYQTFRPGEVRAELAHQGFRVTETQRAFLLPVRLHRWLDRPDQSRTLESTAARLGLTRLVGSHVTVRAESVAA
jgi:2-polyprenyl-3-methyl-5-hydroxy-6-metoxy-1,4-benzoquinol methylase